MRLLKVKCPIICRQIFLYLFVSRLVRVKRWNPKIFSIHSYFIYCSFFFFFFFFFFCCICHFRFGLWQVELVCTKSSNCIPIFNYKIYKPYFMVLTFCSDMQFSTRDSDNDLKPEGSCAQQFKGAWCYSHCHHSNLNGLYLNGSHLSHAIGVNWLPFRGFHYSLKRTETKVK